jgi:hypothetical protein
VSRDHGGGPITEAKRLDPEVEGDLGEFDEVHRYSADPVPSQMLLHLARGPGRGILQQRF